MKQTRSLQCGKFYHIYGRGINRCTIFREHENYKHFMRLCDEYLTPVADIFAWVLMKNHFHLLLRIKDEENIGYVKSSARIKRIEYATKKKCNPSTQLAHMLNAYVKAFNRRYNRTGSLFEKPFRRLHVDDERYFRRLVYYIHNNPVRHGFCKSMLDYPWSSYMTLISIKPTKLQRDTVLGWFNSKSEFFIYHSQTHETKILEEKIFGEII